MVSENGGVLKLSPCPFCEGPPVPIVSDFVKRGSLRTEDGYGDDGLYASAYVFCHECGANGPHHDEWIYSDEEYAEVEREAVRLWNERNARHRCLYDGGEAEGLNQYPRADEIAA